MKKIMMRKEDYLNLEKDENDGARTPAGEYETDERIGEGNIICGGHTGEDGKFTIFYHKGRMIYAIEWEERREKEREGGEEVRVLERDLGSEGRVIINETAPATVGESEGDIRCGVWAEGELIVMTSEGSERYRKNEVNGEWEKVHSSQDSGSMARISLSTTANGAASATVAARKLSRQYLTDSEFDEKDYKSLTADLENAYLEATAQARDSSSFVQPIIARVKVYDKEGELIYTGAPTLLCHPTAKAWEGTKELTSSDHQTVDGYELSLETYRIRVMTREQDKGRIGRAEVWTTPQIHPYKSGEKAYCRPTSRRGQSNQIFARVGLPGQTAGLSDTISEQATTLAGELMSRIETLERKIATIEIKEGWTEIKAGPGRDAEEESEIINKARSKSPSGTKKEETEESTYSAGTGKVSGDVIYWGNLIKMGKKTPGPESYATGFVDKGWKGHAILKYADGSRSISYGEGSGMMPDLFGPSLWAKGNATELTLCIAANSGEVYEGTYALSALPSGEGSIYINKGNRPFQLEASGTVYLRPEIKSKKEWIKNGIGISRTSRGEKITAMGRAEGEIKCFATPGKSESAWDYGRSKMLAFSTDGIFSLKVESDRKTISVNKTAEIGVESQEAVTSSPQAAYAVAGDKIAIISGSSIKIVKAEGINPKKIVYNAYSHRLICVNSEGKCRETALDERGTRPGESFERNDIGDFKGPTATDSSDGANFVKIKDKIVKIGKDIKQELREVKISILQKTEKQDKPRDGRMTNYRVRIKASCEKCESGELKIRAWSAGGAESPTPISRFTFGGKVKSLPVRIAVWRKVEGLRIEITGKVSKDFRFEGIEIK